MSKRPLSAIRVGNFKAFGETQTIPIKPITLIFGPNSAGKSSIIHSLAYAHEVQVAQGSDKTPDLNVHRTDIGGSSIDLGGFGQFVHGRDADKQVELSWDFDVDAGDEDLSSVYQGVEKIQVSVQIGLVAGKPVASGDISDDGAWAAFELGRQSSDAELQARELYRAKLAPQEREHRARIPVVTSLEVLADGEELIRLSHRGVDEYGNVCMNINRFATNHKVFRPAVEEQLQGVAYLAQKTEEDFRGYIDASLSRILLHAKGLCGFNIDFDSIESVAANENVNHYLTIFWSHISNWFETVSDEIADTLNNTQYLGPLRALPPRHFSPGSHKDVDWKAGGGYAWDLVTQDATVRAYVNGWLGKLTKKPYKLGVKEMVALDDVMSDVRDELFKEFYDSETAADNSQSSEEVDMETLDFPEQQTLATFDLDEARSKAWDFVEKIRSSTTAREPQLTLWDGRTEVSHRDVGIGISQVLPVLVAAFGSKEKTIAMEQPELHLHPALQAELADVFIQCSKGEWNNTFILETHSEHLILRIMRRLRETHAGKETGLPPLTPDDVCILYVEPDGTRSIVREMPLNARGELVKSWPGGFFEEGLREQFGDD